MHAHMWYLSACVLEVLRHSRFVHRKSDSPAFESEKNVAMYMY